MDRLNSQEHCKLSGNVRIILNNVKGKEHYEILDISSKGIEIVSDINYLEGTVMQIEIRLNSIPVEVVVKTKAIVTDSKNAGNFYHTKMTYQDLPEIDQSLLEELIETSCEYK